MHEHGYTILAFFADLLKTVFGMFIVNIIGGLSMPAMLHEWISCGVGLLGCIHIAQKIYHAHKYHQRKKEDNVIEEK